jgi:hypothetical protein
VTDRDEGLSPQELEGQEAAALPDREAMSTIPSSLLDLDVNVDAALDLAAPVDAGVAANANAALPIDASVSANILSPDATSVAQAGQTSVIDQDLDGVAIADPDQSSSIAQGETAAPDPVAPAEPAAPDTTTTPEGQ